MIDIGVNLGNTQLRSRIPELLSSAEKAGISHLIITGTDAKNSRHACQLCEQYTHDKKSEDSCEKAPKKYPKLLCTAGVHPHDAKNWNPDTKAEIKRLLASNCVVSVGETGLDFNRNFSSREEQINAFRAQIELACEHSKPLFLHERDAFKDQVEILSDYLSSPLPQSLKMPKAVIHCFTGTQQALETYLDMGFYIGITGWVCDERRGKELASIVQHIPLDRLMIETDAPYLLPRNMPKQKSRVNVPSNLIWVVKKLAECYQKEEKEIIEATVKNTKHFFQLR